MKLKILLTMTAFAMSSAVAVGVAAAVNVVGNPVVGATLHALPDCDGHLFAPNGDIYYTDSKNNKQKWVVNDNTITPRSSITLFSYVPSTSAGNLLPGTLYNGEGHPVCQCSSTLTPKYNNFSGYGVELIYYTQKDKISAICVVE